MKILGIETSCDETAAAVVENGTKILSNITASSAGIHARTGGVIPEDAARKQVAAVIPVVDLALKEAKLKPNKIDAIAVTVGPGLIGSLLVGVETAKTLAYVWEKPIIPVNHLVAHIYANFISENSKTPQFPALALVVSGGHTDLVLMKDHPLASSGQVPNLEWIGGTRDDAAGEAFDKTARLLGLPYPGGPNLSREADKYLNINTNKLNFFPRPLADQNNFDWSFSGLKTAVLNKISEIYGTRMKLSDYKEISKNKNVKEKSSWLAAEVQEAIVDSLIVKSIKAIRKYNPKTFLLGGGVSANKRLREKLELAISTENPKTKLFTPELSLCTDNGAVIACTAYFNYKEIPWKNISTNPELTISD